MYVSTAYSNSHMCHGSMNDLKEELYPLPDEHGMPLDHAAYVKHLLALDPQAAQQEVGNSIFQLLSAPAGVCCFACSGVLDILIYLG